MIRRSRSSSAPSFSSTAAKIASQSIADLVSLVVAIALPPRLIQLPMQASGPSRRGDASMGTRGEQATGGPDSGANATYFVTDGWKSATPIDHRRDKIGIACASRRGVSHTPLWGGVWFGRMQYAPTPPWVQPRSAE